MPPAIINGALSINRRLMKSIFWTCVTSFVSRVINDVDENCANVE